MPNSSNNSKRIWTAPKLEKLGTMGDVAGGKKGSGEVGPGSSPAKNPVS